MWRKLLLCFLIIVFFAACGSQDEADDQSNKDLGTGGAVEVNADSSPGISLPCGGMTEAAAADILGVAAQDIRYSYSDMLRMCSFQAGIGKSVSYAVYVESDAETAAAEMAVVADGLQFLVACEPAADVGDEGIYCSGDRADRLLVRKGAVWVDIHAPAGLDAKKRVALSVLNR